MRDASPPSLESFPRVITTGICSKQNCRNGLRRERGTPRVSQLNGDSGFLGYAMMGVNVFFECDSRRFHAPPRLFCRFRSRT